MRKKLLLASLATIMLCVTSAKAQQNTQKKVNSKNELIELLSNLGTTNKVMFGQQDATLYGVNWCEDDDLDRSDLRAVCGDNPAVLGIDIGGIELGSSQNLDLQSFVKIRKAIINHHKKGGIITISWHAYNPINGNDSWDNARTGAVEAILKGGKSHKIFTKWLDRVANYLYTLKTEDGELIPIIFRPWHEHTGDWFWWGQNQCTTEQYKALWQLTHNYLTSKGLNNLVWAYSPNLGADKKKYMERYPDDKFVDLLGIDIYDFDETNSNSYIANTKATLKFMTELSTERKKPIAFTETGLCGVRVSNWWSILLEAIEGYPISYVLVWRNACDQPDHFFAPYPSQKSADDFKKFYHNNKTLFLKDLQR